ncbi:QsdR family transcriptional regulator [Rhodococcus sp. 66b]|uniref:QsdR family transcriptional regulator n=1 Tax=Rhodococcus sp. 66b TaxID=1945511 RepID=UPI001F52EFB7|nr:QsdR family transcriptional regulator [Rhodococcus sp. 66b]
MSAAVLGCFRQLTREPQKALCILTTGLGPIQGTMVESVRRLIEAEIPEQIRPDLPVEDMAYLLVRVGESFIYNDLLTGGTPDTEKARLAFRLILSRD